jgi:endonuclease III
MEPHKLLPAEAAKFAPDINGEPQLYYQKAREFAYTYYSEEINKIKSVKFEDLTPEKFFSEYIWVVHATGFSAKAVGNFIPRLATAYGTYKSASTQSFDEMFESVKIVCNNEQKAKAVHSTASWLCNSLMHKSWEQIKSEDLNEPAKLVKLPYIGKVTCYHLARNIGLLESVKPDLHLVRMANHWGFDSPLDMIKHMNSQYNEPLGIADLIVWYAASTFGTISIKKEGER